MMPSVQTEGQVRRLRQKVAVVGGGPAGMAAAFFLGREGCPLLCLKPPALWAVWCAISFRSSAFPPGHRQG